MRVRWIDVNLTDRPVRIVQIRVKPIPDDRSSRCVRVVGDEHTASARGCPDGSRVLGSPLNPRNGASGTISPRTRTQLGGRNTIADDDEVSATRLYRRGRKLWAVSFQVGLIAAPVLRAPDRE